LYPFGSGDFEVDIKVAELPEVDVMIAELAARLKSNPRDVKGWKMLGWSYLNTDRAGDAVEAYERALKIERGDAEAEKGLAAAKAAKDDRTSAMQ
jgi:cytochrome c-type biogenesis protein CcmH